MIQKISKNFPLRLFSSIGTTKNFYQSSLNGVYKVNKIDLNLSLVKNGYDVQRFYGTIPTNPILPSPLLLSTKNKNKLSTNPLKQNKSPKEDSCNGGQQNNEPVPRISFSTFIKEYMNEKTEPCDEVSTTMTPNRSLVGGYKRLLESICSIFIGNKSNQLAPLIDTKLPKEKTCIKTIVGAQKTASLKTIAYKSSNEKVCSLLKSDTGIYAISQTPPNDSCKKEDPCKKKDPCKKEDPCKKKEDPCKKKEDPCKKKEDPCKKCESEAGDLCMIKMMEGNVTDLKEKQDPYTNKPIECKDPCVEKLLTENEQIGKVDRSPTNFGDEKMLQEGKNRSLNQYPSLISDMVCGGKCDKVGKDPCKKKESPCKKKDTPCKKKDKKKDTPCKMGEKEPEKEIQQKFIPIEPQNLNIDKKKGLYTYNLYKSLNEGKYIFNLPKESSSIKEIFKNPPTMQQPSDQTMKKIPDFEYWNKRRFCWKFNQKSRCKTNWF